MAERRPRRHRIRQGTRVRYIGPPIITYNETIPTGAEGIAYSELVPQSERGGRYRYHRGEIEFPTVDTGTTSRVWISNWKEGFIEEIDTLTRALETLPEGYYRDSQGKLRSSENHPR